MVAKTAMTELWDRSRVKSCRHRSAGDDKRDQGHASGMFDVVADAEAARVPHDNHRDDEGANRSDKCPFLPAEEAELAVSLDRVELVRGWEAPEKPRALSGG